MVEIKREGDLDLRKGSYLIGAAFIKFPNPSCKDIHEGEKEDTFRKDTLKISA
jgi:hypothetical protein